MRMLEADDDTVIRGRRLKHHISDPHNISASSPLLLTPSKHKSFVQTEDVSTSIGFNLEFLDEGREKSIWERIDIFTQICRRPFFYLCSSVGLITNLPEFSGPQVQNRIICLGISLTFMLGHLALSIRDAHKKQAERSLWSFVIGWIVIVNLRFGYCSLNPLFIGERTWTISMLSLIFCLIFVLVSLAEEIIVFFWNKWISEQDSEEYDETLEHERYQIDEHEHVSEIREKGISGMRIIYSAMARGLSLGCLLFITHWLFTSSTTAVRWTNLPGFPYNMAICLCLNVGAFLSSMTLLLRSMIGTGCILLFGLLFSFLPTDDISYSLLMLMSAILMSLVLPTIWVQVLIRKHPGYSYPTSNFSAALCFGMALLVYVSQVILLEFSTPSSHSDVGWLTSIMKKKSHALLLFSTAIIATFGVGIGNMFRRPVVGKEQDLEHTHTSESFEFTPKGLFKWLLRKDDEKKKESVFSRVDKRIVSIVILACVLTFIPGLGYRLLYMKNTVNQYPDQLIIMTFNVHNGYDIYGRNNFQRVLNTLREGGASVIGLQQSDTNRISASNNDLLEYLSFYLNMHEYYGPSLRAGSFGCSILSAYPLQDRKYFLLPSNNTEQAVMVQAFVKVVNDFDIPTTNITTNTTVSNFYFFSTSFSMSGIKAQSEQAQATTDIITSLWKKTPEDVTQDFATVFVVGDLNVKSDNIFFNRTNLDPVISHTVKEAHGTTTDYISIGVPIHKNVTNWYKPYNSTIMPINKTISSHPPLITSFKAFSKN